MSSTDSKVTTLDDENTTAPVVAKATKVKTAAVQADAPAAKEGMFMVTIHATGDDVGGNAAEITTNGKCYQLPRGVPCLVDSMVFEVLKNAVVTSYKVSGNSIIETHTQRWPFTAVPA